MYKAKSFIRYVSLILSLAILFTSVPLESFANSSGSKEVNSTPAIQELEKQNQQTVKEADIIGEDISKRDISTKHFLKDDMSYEAVIYPMPVHYKKDGKWTDIDNSLVSLKDDQNLEILENKDNEYKIKLAKNTSSKRLVRIQKDKYEISWNIVDAAKSPVKVNDDTATLLKSLNKNEQKKTLTKLTSTIEYPNVFENVDFQYILYPTGVKENIILQKPVQNPVFKLALSVRNLDIKLNEDKTISFYSKEKPSEEVFRMDAPYMFDAKNIYSNSIELELVKEKEGYTLTIKPDQQWLSDQNRQYPVVVDPEVITPNDTSNIHDTHVTSSLDQNYYLHDRLPVGTKSNTGINRAYIKFDLPALTAADMVIDANLKLQSRETNSGTYQTNAYDILADWDNKTIKWSNQPAAGNTIEDFQMVNTVGEYSWNITSVVKKWYTTNKNYGVMLKTNNESVLGYTDFYSCDIDESLEAKRPKVSISYVNNAGLQDYWSYHSMDLGRAGTINVNDYNGNYVLVHNDLETTGSRMPISINHVYNSYQRGATLGYGQGWRLNIRQTIQKQTINGQLYYIYVDGDGTRHYYKSGTSPMGAESGIDLKLTVNSTTTLTLEDTSYNKMSFSTIGTDTNNFYLKSVTDRNANSMVIDYQGTKPSMVTDGAGRKATLTYNTDGNLSLITDPANRVTRFDYTGANLTKITYPDNKVTQYNYTASGNITDAINHDGYKMSLEYYLEVPYRVKAIKESHSDGTQGQKITMEYGSNTTTFTDMEGRKNILQFNNEGNTLSVRNENGDVSNYNYGSAIGKDKNKLTLETKLHATSKNYLQNHNAENEGIWASRSGNGSQGNAAYESGEKYLGTKSLKVTKSNDQGFHNWEQKVTLTKGKTYTLSAYVKTTDVSNTAGKGAGLYISYTDSTGQPVILETNYLTGPKDWTRLEKFFTLPSDASSAEVTVGGTLIQETGTAYFDSFQLEDGKVANSYNLVENANFTYGTTAPDSWSAEYFDENDGVTSDPGTHPKGLDNKVLQITGSGTLSKKVVQTLNLSGKTGDVFFLGGWAKGNAAYSNGKSIYKVSLEIKNNTGAQWFHAFFNEDTPDWQYTSNTIVADRDYTSIRVFVIYYNNANTAMFDGIQLFRENSYQYEYTNGNLTGTTNPEGIPASNSYSGNDLTNSTDENSYTTSYTYDTKHNLKTSTSQEGTVTTYGYDGAGNTTITKIGDDALKIQSNSTYDSAVGTEYKGGNYLKTATDPIGNTVTYNNDWKTGNLTSFIDAIGNTTNYQYDGMDRLKEVTASASGVIISNTYGYTDQSGNSTDMLQTIGHNSFSYNFLYDKMRNLTGVNVGSRNLVSNIYANYTDGTGTSYNTSRLSQVQFGNGQKISYDYDLLDRMTRKSINGVNRFTYDYDENGNIALVTDNRDNTTTRFLYNLSDYLTEILDSHGYQTKFTYDDVGNIKDITEKIGTNSYNTSYYLNKDYNPAEVVFGNSKMKYNYIDPASGKSVGRLYNKSIEVNGKSIYTTSFSYKKGYITVGNASTNVIDQIDNNGNKIQYDYDKNGNIQTITAEGKVLSYDYNEFNELIRENNIITGNTVIYSYDVGGNITEKKIYPYTTETVPGGTPEVISYTYGDNEWKDLLTNFNGKALTYDQIGNLENDGTYTYTWDEGRQLASMNKADQEIKFKYNEDGIRTEKIVNGKTTKYHLLGDKVTYETDGTDSIYYTYDANDNLISMNLNGTEYYYIRNGQHDIIGLFDSTGSQMVSYSYDTWGNILSIDGTLKDTVGIKNPYRYRGYRYDAETELYYLQSRYYNPDMGRFINADGITGVQGEIFSHNMFAYCLNNPINRTDDSGFFSFKNNFYLGVGSSFGFSLFGSLSLKNLSCSVGGSISWKITAGFLGLTIGMLATGQVLNRLVAGWLIRNTFLKEIIFDVIKVSFIASLVFKQVTGLLTKGIKKIVSYADKYILKIPYASYVVSKGTFRFSFNI